MAGPKAQDFGFPSGGGGGGGGRPSVQRFTADAGSRPRDWGGAPDPRQFITGQNTQGPQNGWNSPFMTNFVQQYQHAMDDGSAASYFDQKRDGIALWDDQSESKAYKLGDVFQGGKVVGNVYQQYGKEAGDQMIAPFLLSAQEQHQGVSVDSKVQSNAENIQAAGTRKQFDTSVETIKQTQGDFGWQAASAGALGTGLLGAGIGSLIAGPAGTLVGGLIGGGIGAVTGWMNRDELGDIAARGEAQSKILDNQGLPGGSLSQQVMTLGQLAGKSMSPVSNLVHGLVDTDASLGNFAGDHRVGYYAVNDSGQSTRPGWLTPIDVGATLVDSALQFATPLGRLAYQGQMGTTVLGKSSGLLTSGGQTFDERTGTFDNVFTDKQGRFDLLSSIGGVADIGIDAVQMLGGAGMAAKAGSNGLRNWGKTAEEIKAASLQAEKNSTEQLAGMKFKVNEKGDVTGHSFGVSIFAPSEAVQYLGARAAALTQGTRGAKPTSEALYSAAKRMSDGSRTFRVAMLNGLAEGYEEGVQTIAEAVSHQEAVDPMEAVNAAMYGFASGAGMSAGARALTSTPQERQFSAAQAIFALKSPGQELSRSTWDGMTEIKKQALLSLPDKEQGALTAAADSTAQQMKRNTVATATNLTHVTDLYHEKVVKERKTLNNSLDDRYSVTRGTTDIDDHHIQTSSGAVVEMFVSAEQGLSEMLDPRRSSPAEDPQTTMAVRGAVRQHIELAEAAHLAMTSPGNPDAATRTIVADAYNAALRAAYEFTPTQQQWLDVGQGVLAVRDARLRAEAEGNTPLVNDLTRIQDLLVAWVQQRREQGPESRIEARAVSLVFNRDPVDNDGSFQLFVPQIDVGLTGEGSTRMVRTSYGPTKAQTLDYDGDTLNLKPRVELNDDAFLRMRTGEFLIGADTGKINMLKRDWEGETIQRLGIVFTDPSNAGRSNAQSAVDDIEAFVRNEVPFAASSGGLIDEFVAGLRSGQDNALQDFLIRLAMEHTDAVQTYARAEGYNVYYRINSFVQRRFDQFQTEYGASQVQSAQDKVLEKAPPGSPLPLIPKGHTMNVAPVPAESRVGKKMAQSAATWSQRLWNATKGSALFRNWQSLHFTKATSTEINSASGRETVAQMVGMTEELSQGATGSAMDQMESRGEIAIRAEKMLLRLVNSPDFAGSAPPGVAGLALAANMRVPNLSHDNTKFNQEVVTLLQWATRRVVNELRARDARVMEKDTKLRAAYNQVDAMNAGEMLVYVFGSYRLEELMGTSGAAVLGRNMTLAGAAARYTDQGDAARQADARAMRSHAEYLLPKKDRKYLAILPSDIDSAGAKGPTAYSTVVDSILQYGNTQISWNEREEATGTVHGKVLGKMGEASDRAEEALTSSIHLLQADMTRAGSDRMDISKADNWRKLFADNPDLGLAYLKTMNADEAWNVYEIREGQLFVEDWVYEALTKPPKEAAMMFLRHTILSSWRGMSEAIQKGEAPGVQVDKINDRVHLLMYRLAYEQRHDPSSTVMLEFQHRLSTSKTTDEWVAWLNSSVIRQNEAPYTAWHRDRAALDPTRTKGGWSTVLESATRTESFLEFKNQTERFITARQNQERQREEDENTHGILLRAMRNPNDANRPLFEAFAKTLKQAGTNVQALGPTARERMLATLRWGMLAPAYKKEKAPYTVDALGSMLSKTHALQRGTAEEVTLASLTAWSTKSARDNMGALAGGDWMFTDEEGNQVQLEDLSDPEVFLRLYADEANHAALMAYAHPQVLEWTYDANVEARALTDLSLTALTQPQRLADQLMLSSDKGAATYLSWVDGKTEGQVTKVTHMFSIARTTGSEKMTSGFPSEYAKVQQLETQMAEALKLLVPLAKLQTQLVEQDGSTTTTTRLDALERQLVFARRAQLLQERFNLDPKSPVTEDFIRQVVKDRKTEILADYAQIVDPTAEDERRYQSQNEFWDSQLELDRFGPVLQMYGNSDTDAQRYRLYNYVWRNPGLQTSADTIPAVVKLITAADFIDDATGLPPMSETEWDEVAKAVVTYELRRRSHNFAQPDQPLGPIPGGKGEWQTQFLDPDMSFLITELFDVAKQIATNEPDLHSQLRPQDETDILDTLGRGLFKKDLYGNPTDSMRAQLINDLMLMGASPAEQGISRGGSGPKNETTEGIASIYTTKPPTNETLSSADLDYQTLKEGTPATKVTVHRPTGAEETDLILMNNRFADTIAVVDSAGNTLTDLAMTSLTPGITPQLDGIMPKPMGLVTLARMRMSLERYAQANNLDPNDLHLEVSFWHPKDQPALTPELAAQYANNIYYEGGGLDSGATFPSLDAAWWFPAGGVDQTASRQALDAFKKGGDSLRAALQISSGQRRLLEVGWQSDFYNMLHRKTMAAIQLQPDGENNIDPQFYNVLIKKFKMRHFVRWLDSDGTTKVITAEEAIAQQAAGQIAFPPDAELYILSDEGLRTMLGERGEMGYERLPSAMPVLDPFEAVDAWTGTLLVDHLERMPGMASIGSVPFFSTRDKVARPLKQLHYDPHADPTTKTKFDFLSVELAQNAADIHTARLDDIPLFRDSLDRAMNDAVSALETAASLRSARINPTATAYLDNNQTRDMDQETAKQLRATMDTSEHRTGFVYRPMPPERKSRKIDPITDKIGLDSLRRKTGKKGRASSIADGDLVVIMLDDFSTNDKEASQQLSLAIDLLMDQGAVIALVGDLPSSAKLRGQASKQMRETGLYRRIDGSQALFQRHKNIESPIAEEALIEKMFEVGERELAYSAIQIETSFGGQQENTGQLLPNAPGTVRYSKQDDPVPLRVWEHLGYYRPPLEEMPNIKSLIENAAEDLIEASHTGEWAEAWGKMSPRDQRNHDIKLRAQINKAALELNKEGLYDSTSTFEVGDILPLYNPSSGKLLLYRHGHTPPGSAEQLRRMMRDADVVIYSPEIMAGATTHSGEHPRFYPTGRSDSYGMRVEMAVKLSSDLAKTAVEGTGMKTTWQPASPKSEPIQVLPGVYAMGYVGIWDQMNKAATRTRGNNFQDLATIGGLDFRPELAALFFNTENPTQQQIDEVEPYLRKVKRVLPKEDRRTVAALMEITSLPEAIQKALEPLSVELKIRPPEQLLADQNMRGRSQLLITMLKYLSAGGTHVEDVLYTGGMNGLNANIPQMYARKMPSVFTNALESRYTPELRELVRKRINSQMYQEYDPVTGEVTRGVYISDNLTAQIFTVHDGVRIVLPGDTYLNIVELHAMQENPVLMEQAGERKEKSPSSPQQTSSAALMLGARTATSKAGQAHTESLLEPPTQIETGVDLMQMLLRIDEKDFNPFKRRFLPAQVRYMEEARFVLAGYRVPLTMEDWEDRQKSEYEQKRRDVANLLGLRGKEAVRIDFWIRQRLARSQAQERVAGVDPSSIHYDEAMDELRVIAELRGKGMLPTADGMVPDFPADDLLVLWQAGERDRISWLRGTENDPTSTTRSWDDWVHIALSFGEKPGVRFDWAFLIDLDAVRHTYLDAGLRFSGMPMSASQDLSDALLDPQTNQLVLSVSPQMQRQLEEPMVLGLNQSLTDLFGGERVGMYWRTNRLPSLGQQRTERKLLRSKKGKDMGNATATEQRQFLARGKQIVHEGNTQNALVRTALGLRAGLALLSPDLYIGAPVEAFLMETREKLASILMGEGTVGLAGIASGATAEQRQVMNDLYSVVGQNKWFLSMIGDEYRMKSDLFGAGFGEKATNRLARYAGRWQDPRWGMRADTIARRYIEQAASYLASMGGPQFTAEQLADRMATNPNYIRQFAPEAHEAAMRTLLNLKNVKPTTLSVAWSGVLTPMIKSKRLVPNLFGSFVLQMPFMFANYSLNKMVQLTGMDGFDQAFALLLHGRRKGLLGRFQAAIRGDNYDPEETIDMSSVIETLDLTQAFVKGGISQTALFAFGMAASGLGLSGEGEEDRRRRKAAMYKGFAYMYDPRALENDFRNADSIYMDWLPFNLDEMFRVAPDSEGHPHSMVGTNWLVKSILSPVLGMSRFFDTGNPWELTWGFKDAVTSMPLMNAMMWEDANQMFSELATSASQESGDPDKMPMAFDSMVKGVMFYERMLLESSFINRIYQATDKYDRDAWVLPEYDAQGHRTTNRLGQVQPTGAMQTFTDPATGEVRQGYLGRDEPDAVMHGYTENRLTLAVLSNLVTGLTGGTGGYLRGEMPIKTRKFEKEALNLDEATAVVWGMWKGSVSETSPSLEGVYIPYEMRDQIKVVLMNRIIRQGMDHGLNQYKATQRAYQLWSGSGLANAAAVPLNDILYSDKISSKQSDRYYQLNTTYIQGPDGNMWATGISRNALVNFAGLAPLQQYDTGQLGGMGVDGRLNSVDDVRGINTGMRMLEKVDESWQVPQQQMPNNYQPNQYQSGGAGWRNFGHSWGFGGGRHGGGGGGGGGGSTRLYAPQDTMIPFGRDIPYLRAENPILRRATIRRERVDSQKGRLNQWQ